MKIIAIDEAGRGPVLGPMVMCGVSVDEKNVSKLRDIGVRDSKLLSPEKREELEPQVKKIVSGFKVAIVGPNEIDTMLKRGVNLNDLEMLKTAEIINALEGDMAIIDCPSTNIEAYKRELKAKIARKIELVVEHKADFNHVEVGAASIIAKVLRDSEVKKLQEQYDADFGSGYMSDPVTKKFIEDNWDKYPELFRHSWSSWRELKENKNQKNLFEY
jgi:ribonuclease HII